MRQIEGLEILLDYTCRVLGMKEEILNRSDTASEENLKAARDTFNEQVLMSRYPSSMDAPLLIKDSDGVHETIEQETKQINSAEIDFLIGIN